MPRQLLSCQVGIISLKIAVLSGIETAIQISTSCCAIGPRSTNHHIALL